MIELLLLVVLAVEPSSLSFYQTEGWTGGDGAYSVDLGRGRTLWLFGDTLVGRIIEGRRAQMDMIHNSFAITQGNQKRFFLHELKPGEKESYYWPSDGVLWNGRLWMFQKKVRNQPGGPPGLDFEWMGEDLLEIKNPQADPPEWTIERHPAGPLHPGIACLVHEDKLYAYGLKDGKSVLIRYGQDLEPEYYSATTGQGWSKDPTQAAILFEQAASEMSVMPFRDQFLAVYTRGGLGPEVVARTAPCPEGPWSEPVLLYKAAETGLLLYAGKAHRTLSEPDRLTISYCRNIGALQAHRERPEVYFPRFLEVKLR
ncbi:DUF4185 domain-containing protein [bacterium CPR1]|nr:DUF4185 domain-containing protein [bacterium CPR1]